MLTLDVFRTVLPLAALHVMGYLATFQASLTEDPLDLLLVQLTEPLVSAVLSAVLLKNVFRWEVSVLLVRLQQLVQEMS